MQRVWLTILLLAAACAPASVDKSSVRATSQAPESTQVEIVHVPYDANYPTYVVTVEPFRFDAPSTASGSVPEAPTTSSYGWGPWGWRFLPQGPQAQAYDPPPQQASAEVGNAISAQLVTALGNAGNIAVIDWDLYQQMKGNPAKLVDKKKGEVGPIVIRGSVTEFNEVAEATGSSTGGSLGALGAALGIAGGIAGNAPAAITGTAVGLANPSYESTVARRTGSVGMDLSLVNPSNGRVLGSAVANGTFTSESAANGFSLFGFGKASNAYAASALGQANRMAMNSATTQVVDVLKRTVR